MYYKKLLFIFSIFLLVSCEQDYITVEDEDTTSTDLITISSSNVSVDYAEFELEYDDYSSLMVQLRRDSTEFPPTVYDGDLVFVDDSFSTYILDSSLTSANTFYYSLFYLDSDSEDWVESDSLSFTTLSNEEGMTALLSDVIDYALTLDDDLEILLQGDTFDYLVDDDSIDSDALSESFDGVLLTALSYTIEGDEQDSTTESDNLEDLDILVRSYPVLIVDYCGDDSDCLDTIVSYNANFVGFTRDGATTNFIENIAGLNLDSTTSIDSISDVANFLYIDQLVDADLSDLEDLNYDLIIINPFDEVPNTSVIDTFSSSEIQSLKYKADGETSRLVYAYLDIGFAVSSYYYWDSDFSDLVISQIYSDFDYYTIQYWEPDWIVIIEDILDRIDLLGFDGVVFGSTHAYGEL